MAAKLKSASRELVQVVLRERTSISPDFRGSKRSLAERGVNFTLVGSLKIAAASARQKSTSRPAQLPLSSGVENPGSPWLTPQIREPLSFTALSVCADAVCADRPSNKAAPRTSKLRFMVHPYLEQVIVAGMFASQNDRATGSRG